ncbi:hypothetical protein [Pleomorphovibrio marinus]|uniref:hypothetical protein n=1 Tax=Pleomorphovibrio marinus TaxID=2164132 RepID=UPI000E0CAE17|nr:hypothetical protein [Pleomorphovibrio marinus]
MGVVNDPPSRNSGVLPYPLVFLQELAAKKQYAQVDIETLHQFFVSEVKIGLEKHQSLSRFSGANIPFILENVPFWSIFLKDLENAEWRSIFYCI